ncbi:MAG: dihydrolipoyl dehydrogenase [Oscillospiraceae bacterium]|nr:dihydrolipoyl dehydrogenase [Oscillospiraceae bacterium]
MNDYQLIVIGAGPGGYTAALRAAKLGLRTAVVENREAGGTCLNRGCVPTKTLLHSSEVYHSAKNGAGIGVHTQDITANMEEIFAYKRHISQTLSSGVESLLKAAKVPLLHGTAKIVAPQTVAITDAEGNVSTCTADNILVATGSVPARPPIPGLDLPGVMTSDELLEGTDHLYRSIVIIGGGVIGVEFATFYAELGCEVTVIEGMDRLLPTMDRELGQNLALILKKQGVRVCTSSMVKNVEKAEDGFTVNFTAKGKDDAVTGEAVLCAIGRKPYCEGLFAEGLQPEMRGKSIQVNERYETSIPGVYAIGDVSSVIQLAHVAAAQGTACVEMLCGVENHTDMSVVPSCIYSHPEIAVVGMTDAEAKAAGIEVKVGKCVMGGNARTLIADPGRCFMKVVARADNGQIIGAQLMCLGSTDMISQISEAMANHMTAAQLLLAMRPHPTFEEALTEALQDLVNKLNK